MHYSQEGQPSEGKNMLHDLGMLLRSVNPYDAVGDQLIYRRKITSSSLFHNIMSYTCQSFPHVLAGGRPTQEGQS